MTPQTTHRPRHEPDGRQFSAAVYAGPGGGPARAWRTIRLRYPVGRVVTLVYATEPADPAELPGLLLELQVAAGLYGFTIEVIEADGTTTAAPAIRSAGAR